MLLESGWGESALSKQAYNLFGVKAIGAWNGPKTNMRTSEYTEDNKEYFINANFRKCSSFAESIEDYALFLVNNSRYKRNGLFDSLNYKNQTTVLQRAGYATSPNYSKMLNEIIEQYNLCKYDKKVNYDIKFKIPAQVIVNNLNVRTEPNTSTSSVVKQFNKNDKITLIDYNKNKIWGCTTLGWVKMDYIKYYNRRWCYMFNLIWEYKFIIVVILAAILYATLEWTSFKSQTYSLML